MSNEYREQCLEEMGEVCYICQSEENIVVHHINGDRDDNSMDNIIPVCEKHHHQIHSNSDELEGLKNSSHRNNGLTWGRK